jgi:hypothetical protein
MGQTLKTQPGAELYPFMEMVFAEVESAKFETSTLIAIGVEVLSQLKTERADRQQIEAKPSSLKKNSVPAATL